MRVLEKAVRLYSPYLIKGEVDEEILNNLKGTPQSRDLIIRGKPPVIFKRASDLNRASRSQKLKKSITYKTVRVRKRCYI